MSDKCDNCKKSIGFFGKTASCDHEDCNQAYCENCAAKKLHTCKDCEGEFCSKHLPKKQHPCEEEESSEDDEDSEDSEPEEDDTDEDDDETLTFYGKNDKWAILEVDQFDGFKEQFAFIDKELSEYDLLFQDDDNNYIFKKRGN